MKIIAVVNQKGGCGKTTVSINLASALAEQGQRTLLVDMDPQSHCAVGLAVPEEQIEQSIYDVLISKSRGEPINITEVLWQITEGLELAPSNIDLSAFEQQMIEVPGRENALKDALDDVKNDFDIVVIDCPPAVGLLTFNALRAATDVIVPVETGYFALHGLSKQLETLGILCERFNHKVNVKALASMYDIRTKMAREILAELKNHFSDKMFKTTVNFNTKIKEAASFGQPVCEYDPASRGKEDFAALAKEVVGATAAKKQKEIVESLTENIDSISVSAEELLKNQQPDKQTAADSIANDLDSKLSDYYGVNQINDAVVFVSMYPRAKKVEIAGDFNNWKPQSSTLDKVGNSGIWQTKMNLQPGKYRYRLVVDGQWQQDPYNEVTEANPFGGYNSVVEVKA
jgi:chromosome partitioning protein